jgi:hypothetical protein
MYTEDLMFLHACSIDGDKEETNDDGAPILISVRWDEKGHERRFREDAIAGSLFWSSKDTRTSV